MGELEEKKVGSEAATKQLPQDAETPKDVADAKSFLPSPDDKISASKPPPSDEKALVVVSTPEKHSGGSIERDAVLARLEQEKKLALIKAWEDSEKTKADNKTYKKLSAIGSWENSKKASVEAQLRKIEEKLEKQKAEYAEKIKNKMADIHKAAEEKRAIVEAKRGEDFLKVEEAAAKYRATGNTPKKFIGCFGC